jgi:hypothetical protein
VRRRAGDRRQLRGIPAVSRAVGVSRLELNPVAELMRKQPTLNAAEFPVLSKVGRITPLA